jgi:hypothetical protein
MFNVGGEGKWHEWSFTNVISKGALLITFSKCQQSIYFPKGESKTARAMQASPGVERRAASGVSTGSAKINTPSRRPRRTGIVWRRLPGRGDSSRAPKRGQAPTCCKFVSTLWWQGLVRSWAWTEQGAPVGFFISTTTTLAQAAITPHLDNRKSLPAVFPASTLAPLTIHSAHQSQNPSQSQSCHSLDLWLPIALRLKSQHH